MKKFLLIIIFLFLITGCDSYIELNDLAIINTIGIEKVNDKYHILISLIDEEIENTMEPSTTIKEIEGDNLNQAINDLSLKLSKKIYLSHLDLLVINETIKNNDLETIINFFLNNNETREDFLVVITDNLKNTLEKTKFKEINNLIENNKQENSKTIYTTISDVINNFYQKESIYYPYVTYQESLSLDGLITYINNSYKKIKSDDVIYLNYLFDNIDTYKISYKCDDNKYIYLNILTSKTTTLEKELIITNELKVITNDCKLKKKEINSLFNDNLTSNLKKITNKKITIKNTIRGTYEN